MSLITTSHATDQSSLYKGFLNSVKQEDKRNSEPFNKAKYRLNMSDLTNSIYIQNYSWEDYCNELEFE